MGYEMNDDTDIHAATEAYVTHALDADERDRYERHLATCAPCRYEIETYTTVLASLDGLDVPAPPAIPKLPAARRASGRIARVASFAAAVVAIAGSIAVPRYEHDRASERAYAEIARMLATDPIEVALVGKRGVSGRAIVGEAHRRSGFVVRGLPDAARGYVYRVWIRGASSRHSPGVLEMTREALHVLVTTGDVLDHATSIRIVLEPESSNDRSPRRTMLEGTIG